MADVVTHSPQTLVDTLRAAGHLDDPRVDAAFSRVPRHLFLPDVPLAVAYSDIAVPLPALTDGDEMVSSSIPSMIARSLAALKVREGHNVLHIGTGTGFTAALLSYIVGTDGTLTTLELDRDTANAAEHGLFRAGFSSVNVVHADGIEGYAPRAAYDRILSSVGIWDVPSAWVRQLKPDGLIVAPIWLDGLQVIAIFRAEPDGSLYAEHVLPSMFSYMRGQAGMPAVRRRVGSTALSLLADDIDRMDMAALHLLLSQDFDTENHLGVSLEKADYWYGFLPYMAINEPDESVFALYRVEEDRTAYGMSGDGFAYFTPASACFVPYCGIGSTHTFAGADAFIDVAEFLSDWARVGRPGIDQLRLRLIPRRYGLPTDAPGKAYPRRDHLLHVWMDWESAES